MFEALNTLCLSLMDHLLGWSLSLPRIVVLLALAIGTALILTVVRKFTTNQDLLRRAKADKARLKQLLGDAKRAGDKDAIKRIRGTIGEIGMVSMKSEGLPLLASLLPIALLAIWAFSRIGYLPPKAGETVIVKAYLPSVEIGNLIYMVPQKGLEASKGWIQPITEEKDAEGKVVKGIAQWELKSAPAGGSFVLPLRYKGKTVEKELLVGGPKYADPVTFYEDQPIEIVEVVMSEYKPLDLLPKLAMPGVPWLALDGWLLGYLIIVIPLSFILKPALRIY